MVISAKLKERFCKDCNIPIHVFQEPYFTDRLNLYDKFYGTLDKWERFVKSLEKYNSEQDYFEEYNRVKDEAINFIKSTEAYQSFNSEDMNVYAVTHKDISAKDIYCPSNNDKTFISIDMKKANFSALHYYNRRMFGGADTWEDFIKQFTDNEHIINSKYIRQVILGNCNPKRHITYEKYLMDTLLTYLSKCDAITLDKVVFFSNDEIVFDISDMDIVDKQLFFTYIQVCLEPVGIPLKAQLFQLNKIEGTNGYVKQFPLNDDNDKFEFKCLDSLYLPFVLRYFSNEEVTENDKVFYNAGLLAKFIEVPKIEGNYDVN